MDRIHAGRMRIAARRSCGRKPLFDQLALQVTDHMVFTQGRGFALGASFGLQIRTLRYRVLVCHAADTASLAT